MAKILLLQYYCQWPKWPNAEYGRFFCANDDFKEL